MQTTTTTTTPVVHLQIGNLIPRLSPPLPNNACLAHTFNSFPSILPSLSRPPLLSPLPPLVSVSEEGEGPLATRRDNKVPS